MSRWGKSRPGLRTRLDRRVRPTRCTTPAITAVGCFGYSIHRPTLDSAEASAVRPGRGCNFRERRNPRSSTCLQSESTRAAQGLRFLEQSRLQPHQEGNDDRAMGEPHLCARIRTHLGAPPNLRGPLRDVARDTLFQTRDLHDVGPPAILPAAIAQSLQAGRALSIWLPPNEPCQSDRIAFTKAGSTTIYTYYDPPNDYSSAAEADRTLKACARYDNGADNPLEVKRESTKPNTPACSFPLGFCGSLRGARLPGRRQAGRALRRRRRRLRRGRPL